MPAVAPERVRQAREAGRTAMEVLKRGGPLPRELVTRKSIENACAAVAATGARPMPAAHPAIAHEAGIRFDLDDFARVARRTPLIADMQPGGRFLARDLHEIGGVYAVLKDCCAAVSCHGDCLTLFGTTLEHELRDHPGADGKVVRKEAAACDRGIVCSRQPRVRWRVDQGRRAQVVALRRPARVFESEKLALQAVRKRAYRAGDVLVIRHEGPRGGPGMREMLGVTALLYGQGMGEKVALVTDGASRVRRAA
jgi:dihydroxy-acid dehydratase